MLDTESFTRHDWSGTPLGPRDAWPTQLVRMSEFLLCSKQPMFMLWGRERAFIYNAAYQAIWGIESLDTLGRPIEEVAGGVWERLRPHVERVFEGESFLETNFGITGTLDHELRYFDFSYTPIDRYDVAGEIAAALCITTDVTERILSAERTSQDREVLALTLENDTEGVALVERDLTLVLWNEPFRVHFGFETGQIRTGMNAAELMMDTARRGDLGEGDPEVLVRQLAEGIQTNESGSLEVHRKNGRVLDLYRRTVRGGRFLLVSRDITEERTAARLKDELVSTVSHELRTPLTAISGALGIVSAGAAGTLTDKASRLIGIAQRNSERLIALVNDLLDIDKLQSGKAEFAMAPVDLAELVVVAVEQNLPYADRGGIRLEADVPASPVVAMADRNRILQVLTNLISNAVKFSPADEQVIVRLAADGRRHGRISVIDRGIGVAEEFRQSLFERFTQQDSSSKRVQQGTGLGLAISKSIVERHGGSIWLDTAATDGATFHIELPLAEEMTAPAGELQDRK
jgi:signal transduction histidine kinase